MSRVRIGVIGMGGMGSWHAEQLHAGKVRRCRLTAVCDIRPGQMDPYRNGKIGCFGDSAALIRSGMVDAVLVATPHYSHTTIGIDALKHGLHLLTEKPLSVHKKDCQRLIAAHRNQRQIFGIMFQLRTFSLYQKMREIVGGGTLGRIFRVNWIVTDWFRTDTYYASSPWRATWKGEGGGILINQLPHNLDLLQWVCGMPSLVQGACQFGQGHGIEVEDNVSAYLEWPSGATGMLTANTCEAPGTNRWEICGELGKLVLENGKLSLTLNRVPMGQFRRRSPSMYAQPERRDVKVPLTARGGDHNQVTRAFVDAILDGTPLVARGEEGIRQVEISNSILYSSLTGRPVRLPLDADAMEQTLKRLIARSKPKQRLVQRPAGEKARYLKS